MSHTKPFPDHSHKSLRDALQHAQRSARQFDVAHVVVLHVEDNVAFFTSMIAETYTTLRERGTAGDLAHIVTVAPHGRLDVSPAFRDAIIFPNITEFQSHV